jgi:copper chaperone CopZ
MSKVILNVEKHLCAECSLALRRFIGNMDGVQSIDVENGKIAIDFDPATIAEEKVRTIAKDSTEKLGYKLLDEEYGFLLI